ncbi:hypothetical protein GACE_1010 [Geoglobus acetivorans]|uniref:Uncharacterized protein n=1 Tax=Geoglobus acetivorans TaxID=565033 RepID=A0A0A7GDA6_GEOAI|nr:hypothetical protein GACE_1010 [Geoglobus acetivorans]
MSLVLLAVYITAVIMTGIFSSWEYAAFLSIVFSFLPLLLIPNEYIAFLQIPLIEDKLFVVNNLTVLLLFNSFIIAYAFSAWVRTLFVLIFVLTVMHSTGLLQSILGQILPLELITDWVKEAIQNGL